MEGERPRPTPSTTTTTTSEAAAAAIIAYNEDLLTEILILLPAKSLIRFKSVSKIWYSLISDASFSHLHTLRHRRREPQSSFLLRTAPLEYFYFSPTSKSFLSFHFNSPKTTILQSCHGLLLLECSNPDKNYYVCNPTTRQSRNLLIENEFLFGLRLAYDPLESPHYKIVCVRTKTYSIHWCEIQVYDSKIHKWKHFKMNFAASLLTQFNNGVYWKNCIYWIPNSGGLLGLDIEAGFFRFCHPVSAVVDPRGLRAKGVHLMESSGLVHFVAHNINSLMVYEVIEQNYDWFVKYSVNCDHIIASFGDKISLIGILRREDQEKWSMVFHVPGKIMVYRFDDESLEELIDLRMQKFYREGKLQFGYHDAFQFIESLNPV